MWDVRSQTPLTRGGVRRPSERHAESGAIWSHVTHFDDDSEPSAASARQSVPRPRIPEGSLGYWPPAPEALACMAGGGLGQREKWTVRRGRVDSGNLPQVRALLFSPDRS